MPYQSCCIIKELISFTENHFKWNKVFIFILSNREWIRKEGFLEKENFFIHLSDIINRTTGVVNNDQITESISSGVEAGVYNAMMAGLSQNSQSGGDLNVTVKVGSTTFINEVVKGYNRIKRAILILLRNFTLIFCPEVAGKLFSR